MHEKNNVFPPNTEPLEVNTSQIGSADIGQYIIRLISRQVETLLIDGCRIVSIKSVETKGSDDQTHVIGQTESGELHEFVFSSFSLDQTITHKIIKKD